MPDACGELTPLIRAKGQLDGVDPFKEADRLKNLRAGQKAYYELAMADLLGINPAQRKGPSVYDVLDRAKLNKRPGKESFEKFTDVTPEDIQGLSDGQLYDTPSQILPKKFYDSVDKRLTDYQNSLKGKKDANALKEYNKQVVSPVRKVMVQLDKSIVESKGNKKLLTKKLKGFGLTPETVYEGREWMKWLADGGHLKKDTNVLDRPAKRLSRGMANLNLLWSGGNIADTIRVFSHYSVKPGGMKAIAETITENLKNNPFKRRADLAKKDIYSYQGGTERIDFGNSDPFAWTLTMQKNIAHDLDVKMGGNGTDAIENLVFDTKPWNVPRLYRVGDPSGVFGLVRYPINESRWLIKEHNKIKDAFVKDGAAAAVKESSQLLTYYGARTMILGAGVNMPAFIYEALPQENDNNPIASKKFWQDISKASLVGGSSALALQAAGIDAELDLSSYFQPFGGKLALRYGLLSDTGEKALQSGTKAAVSLAEGKPVSAALDLAVAAASINNILGLGQVMKVAKLPGVDRVTKIADKANSTTLTKMLDTTAKAVDEEYSGGKYTKELLKDVAGSRRIRSTKQQSTKRKSRPKRPKRA